MPSRSQVLLAAGVLAFGALLGACSEPVNQRSVKDVRGDASSTAASTSPATDATTGVPTGVELVPSDSVVLTQDGAVVDRLAVRGVITVRAADVTIRRTLVRSGALYAIRCDGCERLLVEDVEIDGQGTGGAAVCCSDFTLRRVDIHDVTEGPRLGDNSVVEESWIHHLARCEGCHQDTLQITGGSHIVVARNTLHAFNPDTGQLFNAALQFGEEFGPVRDVLVEDNVMNGGNYTVNGGGGGTRGAEVVFRGNRFGRDFRYGVAANLGDRVTWMATNVWADTGQPVKP